ncbi:hypothetical protein H4582DRAFT_2038349 [Lactarius indigo]|nr:hypothetical protein H4582DRAFT_2038349 [Lactarius indigo]
MTRLFIGYPSLSLLRVVDLLCIPHQCLPSVESCSLMLCSRSLRCVVDVVIDTLLHRGFICGLQKLHFRVWENSRTFLCVWTVRRELYMATLALRAAISLAAAML